MSEMIRFTVRITTEEDRALRDLYNKMGGRVPLSTLGGFAVKEFVSKYAGQQNLDGLLQQLELPL